MVHVWVKLGLFDIDIRFFFAYRMDYLPGADNEPSQGIRCPVHGMIEYSRNERKIIDHPVFQRLRNVRQLAMEHLVYPGGVHTRFEHCLGAMDLATQMFDHLLQRHRDAIVGELKLIDEFRDSTVAKARQVLRLVALLHDVGHPAFAHAGESAIPRGNHEELSAYVMSEVLKQTLEQSFFSGIPNVLVRVLKKSPDVTFLSQLISGEVDADRADYLLRDSLHCGVTYGLYDSVKLVDSLTLIKDPDDGRLEIALDRGGEHTFEALILARYQMNVQVYFHKIRRIYDHYLEKYSKIWGVENYKSFDDVLSHDDISVTAEIRKDAKKESPASAWARRIVERRHHRVVHETGDSADLAALKRASRVLKQLQEDFPEADFYLDDSKVSIYKLWVPGQQEEPQTQNLYIKERNGNPRLLTEDSIIIGKIPSLVRTVRIFADAEEAVLAGIRERAKELEGHV